MPIIPRLDQPLTDGRVALRMRAERDIPEILIAYEDDPRLHERLGEARPPSGADLGRASEEAERELHSGVRAQLAITEVGADTCIGLITISELDWENLRGEVQVWVAPAHRRRGHAGAALRLATAWVFAAWGIVRLAALVEPDNQAMLATAAAAGFVNEGTLRAYRPVARTRQRVDVAVYSLLAVDRP